MRKDHKTQKNFVSVAVTPRLHLANNDSIVTQCNNMDGFIGVC